MSYEIKITRKETSPTMCRELVKLRDQTDLEKRGDEKSGDPQYGYRDIEKNVTRETEILSQTVSNIDLVAIIKAINGIA